MSETTQREAKDLLQGDAMRIIWTIPQVGFFVGFFLPDQARTPVWLASMGLLGSLCLYNARRCGRLHCYLTGPFYLLGAFVIAFEARGLLDFGRLGWVWLDIGIAVLGNLLSIVPEKIWGKYV